MARQVGLVDRPAHEQLQRSFDKSGVQPLPEPYRPGRIKAADIGIEDPGEKLGFLALGDVGGVKTPGPQNAVSVAMQQRQQGAAFALILGDVVYFNGQEMGQFEGRQTGYMDQFYEAYAKLARPIIAFPGNHDAEPEPKDTSLSGFMTNFCDSSPKNPPEDLHLEFGRHTQTLPYCEWTLELDAVTIVAVYTNAPEGGHLEPEQLQRLTQELKDADPAKPLIVGLHHPPYSVDSHHGGSEPMGKALDQAIAAAGRAPDLVLAGHVHNYQRFTRTIAGKQVTYIVSGNGGYHNLHQLAKGIAPGDKPEPDITFELGDASQYGFLQLSVSGGVISGEYVGVKPGTMPDGSDAKITRAVDTF
jgi:predicted MPP superfamily phosphohydrolase